MFLKLKNWLIRDYIKRLKDEIDTMLKTHLIATENSDPYFLGMANGMVFIKSIVDGGILNSSLSTTPSP